MWSSHEASTGSDRERGHLVRQRAQPAPAFRYKNSFSKEFALRAQADRMSALPVAPGTDLTASETPGDSGAILACVPVILRSNDRPRSGSAARLFFIT